MTIMSLLGVSQSAEAVLYAPTTVAGVTRVIEYTDADQQNLFAVNQGLGASLLGQFQAGLQDPKGMVTGSTINGVLVSLVNVGPKVAIAQPQADGTTAYILVGKGTDSAGKAVSALTVANEYLNITSTPGYTPKANLAALIATPGTITKDAPNQATIDLITTSLNGLKTATKQADEKISATNIIAGAPSTLGDSATFGGLTDPKEIIEAQVAAQALTTKLNSVALPVINANPAPVTATAGALTTVVNSPLVQVAATKEAAAASTTVVAAILADPTASPVLKSTGASVQSANAIAAVSALTNPGLAAAAAAAGVASPATATALAAAQASVATSIATQQTQTAALVAALPATDPAVIAAKAALTASATQAATAQAAAATAIATAPGATLDQLAAAKAAADAANAAAVANGGTAAPVVDVTAGLTQVQKDVVTALAAKDTAIAVNQPKIDAEKAAAANLAGLKTAYDTALATAKAAGATQAQRDAAVTAYNAYKAAATVDGTAAVAAAQAIVDATNAYITKQTAYIASLAANDPNLAAETAKLNAAKADVAAGGTAAVALAQAQTDAATLAAGLPLFQAEAQPVFFGAAAQTAQANVVAAQAAVATAATNYANAVAALTPAQQTELAALQAGTLTGAAKTAAQKDLAPLLPLIKAQVAAQTTLIAKQTAFVAALKADPNGAASVAAETANLATMTAALASVNSVLAAIAPVDAVAVAAAAKVETSKVLSAFAAGEVAGVLSAEARLNAAAQASDQATAMLEAQNLANELAKVKTTQFQARHNSTSGIAGNPASNMNMAIDGAFNQVADFGGTSEAAKANVSGASADIGGVNTSVGVGLQYGYYNIGNKSVNTVTMPLSVTAKFNPKHQLTLSVPLSYIQTQGQADAYQVGVTAAYKYNVSDNWSLTPSASYSYRSFDNSQNQYWNPNTSTSLVGGSITSKYTWNFSQVGLSLINMIGHYQTLDSQKNSTANLNITGLGNFVGTSVSNNGIASYVVKNGLHATKMFGSFKLGAYFTDTEYFGSQLYFNQMNEFGFSLKPVNAGRMLDALSIDANYLFSIAGKHSSELDGFRLNLGYKF